MKERGLIVGVFEKKASSSYTDRRIGELRKLADTGHIEVFETVIQKTDSINPATYMGKGKTEEILQYIRDYKIEVIIISVSLSPVQLRNLENIWQIKVIDRNELILDIFAANARTNIAKIETELAQYSYMLPRLTGMGVEMSRTGGGIGTRGPGEKKLEMDRRKILKRIDILQKKLDKYRQDSLVRRKQRESTFTVSLLGYTNAGKSTIMNYLTGNNLIVRDQMFTTLDTTSRRLFRDMVLTDTVGFLGELPHELIESFSLTLSEAVNSDLKLIITDISDEYCEHIVHDVNIILNSLENISSDRLYVFNKTDMAIPGARINQLKLEYENAVFVSAKTGENMDKLKEMIIDIYLSKLNNIEKRIHVQSREELNFLLSKGIVRKYEEQNDEIFISAYLKNSDYAMYRKCFEKEEK